MIMVWWQWLLTIGIPALAVGTGLLLGKLVSSKYFKIPSKPLFKSRRTYAARHGLKTITFDKFLELYQINPKKWSWSGDYYGYWETKKSSVFYVFDSKIDEIFPERTEIYWETERDVRRFNKWIKEMDNRKLQEQQSAEYKLVLEDVQKDVQAKMDAIQKEREAELKRIEEERQKKRAEYDRLAHQMSNMAYLNYETAINTKGEKYISQYTTNEPKVIYFPSFLKSTIKDNDYKLMYEGQVYEYFEADCGIPYLRAPEGNILEVKFV